MTGPTQRHSITSHHITSLRTITGQNIFNSSKKPEKTTSNLTDSTPPSGSPHHLHIIVGEVKLHEHWRGALGGLVGHLGGVVRTLDVVAEALLVLELLGTPATGEALVVGVDSHVFPDVLLAREGLSTHVAGVWPLPCVW